MKRLLVALVFLTSSSLGAQERDVQLESFDAAWRLVQETHFDTTFNGVDWPSVRDQLRPRAIAAPQDTIRQLIQEMVARLGQSHFALIPKEMADDPTGGSGSGTAGFDVRLIDSRIVVTEVDRNGPAAASGVKVGWVLTAVDSRTIDDLLSRIAERKSRYSNAFRAAASVSGWLQGEPGSEVTVHFLDADDRATASTIQRGPAPGEIVKFGDFPAFYARFAAREVNAAPHKVGVIWFSTWMIPLMRQVDSAVNMFRDLDGIVLDLRGNRGGIAAMVMGVAGHFTPRRDTLGLFRSRQATLAFAANPRRASPDGHPVSPFAGPVAILIDDLSASASEIFAGGMQAIGRARVFGSTSLGGVLPARWDRLPNGDLLYHAIADFVAADGTVLEGRGVLPDVPITVTRNDFLRGRDPVLEAALRWIEASPKTTTPGGTR
jgi:carboxyl-terminal processing protease